MGKGKIMFKQFGKKGGWIFQTGLIFFILFLTVISSAETINVPDDYSTIQSAIDAAELGDTIIVSQGIYNEAIYFKGKDITLCSTDPTDPNVVANTIIDQSDVIPSLVRFSGDESSLCTLSGFTIINTNGVAGYGTEANVSYNDITSFNQYTAIILNCDGIISNNFLHDGSCYGMSECDGTIKNNIITRNKYLGIHECNGLITNNIITENPDGIYDCHGTIQNNIIYQNEESGISDCANSIIQNNTIYGNGTYGIYNCGESTIQNCILWGNYKHSFILQISESSTPNYSCIQGWNGGGSGNINSYPGLLDPDNGYFSLLPVSPCIDSGTIIEGISEDIEGNSRPTGDGYDMGAYEYTGSTPGTSPEKPINLTPVHGDTQVSLTPVLISSDFVDFDSGEYHLYSHYQVDNDSSFSSPIYERRNAVSKTHLTLPEPYLDFSKEYWWRVRYCDSNYVCSDWSEPTKFTTLDPYIITVPDDYTTIQAAIDSATRRTAIVVSPGTYYENINFNGIDIILRSTDPTDPNIVESTIIDGSYSGSVVTFSGDETAACVLSGFTITHGNNAYYGGGIYSKRSEATIENNIIIENTAGTCGGGIYLHEGIIRNNIISANRAKQAGGLYSCHGLIFNNIISMNYAFAYQGGGLFLCSGFILNNTIYKNSSEMDGGGIYKIYGVLQNCIIWDNDAPQNPDMYVDNDECIANYNYIGNGKEIALPEFYDPEAGDFRLKPNSPCVDAGGYTNYVTEDILGTYRGYNGVETLRGDGSDYDIGAYEYHNSMKASLNVNPGEGFTPLEVELIGEATAEDFFITSYSWIFDVDINPEIHLVSNASHIVSTTSYTYLEAGTYNIHFIVENNMNETQFAIQAIHVYPPDPILDLDNNGEIDMGDLLEFIECWDKQNSNGDFNGDEKVDNLDLFYLSNRWGIQFDRKH